MSRRLKQPRVYIDQKSGMFFTAYYDRIQGKEIPSSTGIKADIPYPKKVGNKQRDPDWWRISAHAEELENKVDIAAANRTAARNGQPYIVKDPEETIPTFEALLELRAKKHERGSRAEFSKATRTTYKRAIKAMRAFKKNATIANFTSADAGDFKTWLKKKGYADETVALLLRKSKSLFKTAIDHGFIERRGDSELDPFSGVSQPVDPKLRIPHDIIDEKRHLIGCYAYNRKLFDLAFMFAITGYSWADIYDLDISKRKGDIWHMVRTKMMKRPHLFPDSQTMRCHVDLITLKNGRLFDFKNAQTFNEQSHQVSNSMGLPHFTTSTYKDCYGEELDNAGIEGHVLARLMHHKVRGDTAMASDRYLTHLKQMRKALDETHPHWLLFRQQLEINFVGLCEEYQVNPDPDDIRKASSKGPLLL